MQKKEIKVNINDFPSELHYIFENTRVYADFTFIKPDTFIHGDFCLPNIILDNWKFSTFIDLGLAGAGDRHIDIYWVLWSLNHNLKTDIRIIFWIYTGKKSMIRMFLKRWRKLSRCLMLIFSDRIYPWGIVIRERHRNSVQER